MGGVDVLRTRYLSGSIGSKATRLGGVDVLRTRYFSGFIRL